MGTLFPSVKHKQVQVKEPSISWCFLHRFPNGIPRQTAPGSLIVGPAGRLQT